MSLIIYALGLMSLLAADFAVTKFLDPDDIAVWAQVRSLLGIAGVLCTMGFDQVLVRSPERSAQILRIIAVQVPLLAMLVGLGIVMAGFMGSWWLAAGLAGSASASLIMFQYYRSHYHRIKSQFSQQGWKIVVAAALAVMIWRDTVWPLDTLVVGVLVVCAGTAALGAFYWRPSGLHKQVPGPKRDLYAIGLRFMITSLFLALAIYAEQLLVNKLGTVQQAASYFTHATYFLFPISVVNGYVAFRIGPWIRDNHDKYLHILRSRIGVIGAAILVYCACVSAVGWIGWQIVGPQAGTPDYFLQITFGIACIMRTHYVLAAGYIGVFAQPRQHDFMIAGQVFSFGLVIALFWMTYGPVWGLLQTVAFASAINWTLRTVVAFATMRYVVVIRKNSAQTGIA